MVKASDVIRICMLQHSCNGTASQIISLSPTTGTLSSFSDLQFICDFNKGAKNCFASFTIASNAPDRITDFDTFGGIFSLNLLIVFLNFQRLDCSCCIFCLNRISVDYLWAFSVSGLCQY